MNVNFLNIVFIGHGDQRYDATVLNCNCAIYMFMYNFKRMIVLPLSFAVKALLSNHYTTLCCIFMLYMLCVFFLVGIAHELLSLVSNGPSVFQVKNVNVP